MSERRDLPWWFGPAMILVMIVGVPAGALLMLVVLRVFVTLAKAILAW